MQNELAEKVEEQGQEVEVAAEEEKQEENVSRETSDDLEEKQDKDEELEQYSKGVQARISKITHKYREEEAQRKAAVEFAEAVKKQNEELKKRIDELDKSYVTEAGSRVESQIESAKQAYQKAYDEGNSEQMFEAQKTLSRLALDQAQLEQAEKRREQQVEQAAPEAPTAPQPQQKAPPDPKAEAWAEKNEWFGTDQTMTYAAFGIHRQLIEEEGFDPTSDEYYSELDRRVRTEFPHKFSEARRDSGPRVASAESSASKAVSSKGRRTVKLTSSQIAIAKRLNVPLEEYAKYVKE